MAVSEELRARVEEHIREHELIPPGGEVVALVSGGADSTCLWHALGALGYRVSALHVNHGLRGEESDEDARFCREVLGAEVVERAPARASRRRPTEERRSARRCATPFAADRLRATGHTASDQVETVLYRLVASGNAKGIKPKREDGVVRPLLTLWREETEAYCRAEGLEFRRDTSNPDTRRGLIRDEILPLLRRLHPGAEQNLLRARRAAAVQARPSCSPRAEGSRPHRPRPAASPPCASTTASGSSRRPSRSRARSAGARGRSNPSSPGLKVRSWRPGDRLAGRRKKVQDVFVDAKIPRSEREAWPLVVRGREVVAVPGLVEAPGVTAERA